jgi:hypothetical protein
MDKDSLNQFDGQILDGLEFCAKAYALYESLLNESDGSTKLRARAGWIKKFIGEILPISNYIQANYRIGRYISVKWVNGSQQYDAEIFQRGRSVSDGLYPENAFLEVTGSMHQNEYLMREVLNQQGFAFGLEGLRRLENGQIETNPVSYTNRDFIDKDEKLILERIVSKATIPYPSETTLIIDCKLHIMYYEDDWKELITRLQIGLPETNFREIYLYNEAGRYSFSFFPI